ncbi:MAG: 50S ribosomal protein L3 N(5)-glutamine methyltransferase [Afipia sp.]|nr:50S ribosomal protein L3 N(5)-glutamine methyltransferase [Afipia sp.]
MVTARRPTKKTSKRTAPKKKPKAPARALGNPTASSLVREAVRRYAASDLVFAHGTTDPVAEAAFLLCETLSVHPAEFDRIAKKPVSASQAKRFRDLIAQRIETRRPAAYLVHKMYMLGHPFYVDERVIVPRSYIGELLDTLFDGGDLSLIDDPSNVRRVLDLCTGSGCLAILAALRFPNATIDAVDLSTDALDVARRNIAHYALGKRISLHPGDLFGAIGNARYDLIITNPPYVDAEGMADLPRECEFEPAMAFDGGADGLDLVRRILGEAKQHLTLNGGLLCEIGRGRDNLDRAYPNLPLLWLDTEDSEGEVFWIAADAL